VAAGVWVPVEIVIARPFIQHLMLSAIVAVAGSKTGATLFGPADSAPPASMHCTHTHTHTPPTHTAHTPPTHRPHTAHIRRSQVCVAAQCNCRPTRLSRPSRVRRVLSRTRARLSALHSLSLLSAPIAVRRPLHVRSFSLEPTNTRPLDLDPACMRTKGFIRSPKALCPLDPFGILPVGLVWCRGNVSDVRDAIWKNVARRNAPFGHCVPSPIWASGG
jgi:hypothetical protein